MENDEKKQKNDNDTQLDQFNWDEGNNFFNIDSEEKTDEVEEIIKKLVEKKEIKEEEKKEEEKDKSKKSKEKEKEEEKEEPVEFFSETVTTSEEDSSVFKTTAKLFKDKGIFTTLKDEDVATLETEDDFEEIFEKELDARLEEKMEEFVSSLDEDAKNFIKFKRNNGRTSDFFNSLETDIFLDDLTKEELLEDERIQEEFLRGYFVQFEKVEEEDLDDKIEFLKEKGKLTSTAEKNFEKLDNQRIKAKADALKKAEEEKETRRKNTLAYQEDLKKTLNETEVVGKINISKKDKTELFNYLVNPTIKNADGTRITEFQKNLSEVYKDKKSLIALAKVIKEGFNIDTTNTKTEVVKQVKRALRQSSETTNKKSLTDYFS